MTTTLLGRQHRLRAPSSRASIPGQQRAHISSHRKCLKVTALPAVAMGWHSCVPSTNGCRPCCCAHKAAVQQHTVLLTRGFQCSTLPVPLTQLPPWPPDGALRRVRVRLALPPHSAVALVAVRPERVVHVATCLAGPAPFRGRYRRASTQGGRQEGVLQWCRQDAIKVIQSTGTASHFAFPLCNPTSTADSTAVPHSAIQGGILFKKGVRLAPPREGICCCCCCSW